MQTYLITGGAGFIGSHLVDRLISDDCKVRVYDNFSTGTLDNFGDRYSVESGNLEIINADIRDIDKLSKAMDGVDGVFHLAALVSVPQSIEEPAVSFDINSRGSQIVLDLSRQFGIGRVVQASSAAVYGDSNNVPLKESEITIPLSPYGLDKQIGERLGALYSTLYGLNVTCLRFFNVFGPRQSPSSPYSGVVSKFAEKAAAKLEPTIYGTGEQVRDFVYVKDVVTALMLAMQSSISGFRVYNVGSGCATTINALWNFIQKLGHHEIVPKYAEARVGDIEQSIADISLIKRELGDYLSSSMEDNLFETYKWFINN